jgi:hypothetical protein
MHEIMIALLLFITIVVVGSAIMIIILLGQIIDRLAVIKENLRNFPKE